MQIEEGKYYRTRAGAKVGPMRRITEGWEAGEIRWWGDGRFKLSVDDMLDIVAEWTEGDAATAAVGPAASSMPVAGKMPNWPEHKPGHVFVDRAPEQKGPVRLVQKREIVSGQYGCVSVGTKEHSGSVWIVVDGHRNTAELRAAAAVFLELAEALEGEAK